MSTLADLRERVRLESPHHTPDTFGGNETEWQLVGEYFSHVEALGTRQAYHRDGQMHYQPHYRVSLRAPRTLNSDMRLIWRERILVIDSIVPHARMVEISCHEEQA